MEATPDSRPRVDPVDTVDAALDAESARGNRELASYRLAVLSIFVVLMAAFQLFIPGWIGPLPELAGYWVVGAGVWWYSRRSEATARSCAVVVPVVDLPLLSFVMLSTMSGLQGAGFPAHAQAMRLAAAAFFLLLIVGMLPGLDVRMLLFATVMAAVCEIILIMSMDPDLTLAIVMATSIGAAGTMAVNVTRRTRSLVRTTATDEARRRRLERYFSPQVAEHVERATDSLAAGEARHVTILFCDIRDFTRLSESLPSEAVVELLNDFHGCMVDVIFDHGGTLDKLMGDGLMAYFGAPVEQPDHALRAVRCAIAMQAALCALNDQRAAADKPALAMGVGVHSGAVVLGDIGASHRRDFTIVGDAVNVASRIERLTRTLDRPILLSAQTREQIGSAIELEPTEPVSVAGKSTQFVCYYPTGSAPG